MGNHVPAPRPTSIRRRRFVLGAGAAAFGALGVPRLAGAQAGWPAKTIRIVAAQAPGASNDTTARALAEYLQSKLGVSVVVENKPGGVGMIAAEMVARSAPDGYTLLMILHSNLAQSSVLLKKAPIDVARDLVPIGAYSTGVSPLVVKKDLPVNNLKELIALAKRRPVTVGNYAIGSGWQIMMTQLAKQTGAQFDIVPYKGTGPMLMDLMGGNVEVGAGSMAGMAPGIQRGAVRPIMLINGDRSQSLLPGMPTWADEGFVGPAYQDLVESNMLLAPTGTPRETVARLGELIATSTAESPRVKAVMEQLGVTSQPPVGEDLKAFIARTWPAYQRMTRELGLTID